MSDPRQQPTIAEFRHRLAIQSVTLSTDGQGGSSASWSTLATVWGKVEPTNSRERLFAQQIQYQRSHVAWIRHRTDVTTDMRIVFDSRYFQIKGIRRPDEKKFFLILDLEENQGS